MKFKLAEAEVVSIHDRGPKCDIVFRGRSSRSGEVEEHSVCIAPDMEARDRYIIIAAMAKMRDYRFETITIDGIEEDAAGLMSGGNVVCMLT